jgi:NADH-quinone oxidoreductase subunit L
VQVPEVTHALDSFLEPTFEESAIPQASDNTGLMVFGLALGTVLGMVGIAIAYRLWVQTPDAPARIQARFAGLHKLFVNKWYFDEAIDLVIVRPFAWFGRFGHQTFERIVVGAALIGGPTGLVRAGSAAVRALQSSFLRAYAALLFAGVAGVIFYFLVQS